MATSTSDKYFRETPDFDEPLALGLVPAPTLRGRVLLEGEPAAGARVELRDGDALLAAVATDGEGAFALDTSGWDRREDLVLTAADGAGRRARETLGVEDLEEVRKLALTDPVTVDVVVRGASGPLPGAVVLATSEGARRDTALTGEDGRARLVHARSGPGRSVWLQARFGEHVCLAVELEDGEPWPDPVELLMEDGGWFAGRVEDVSGAPLAAARVGSRGGRFTLTDGAGFFELGPVRLEDGAARLWATADDHRPMRWDGTLPGVDLRLVLEPRVHWTGRVTDAATGAPLAGAQVGLQEEVLGDGGPTWEQEGSAVRSDAHGAFAVEIPGPGRFRLAARGGEHQAVAGEPLDTDGLGAPPPTDLALPRAALLDVRVTDGGGRPVSGYRVLVLPGEEGAAPRPFASKLTDADGRVRFQLGDGGLVRPAPTGRPGELVERRLLVPATGGLDLVLRDGRGAPLAGLRVSVVTDDEEAQHALHREGTVPDARELIEVRDLPPGTYRVQAGGEGLVTVRRQVTVQGGTVGQVEMTLAEASEPATGDG